MDWVVRTEIESQFRVIRQRGTEKNTNANRTGTEELTLLLYAESCQSFWCLLVLPSLPSEMQDASHWRRTLHGRRPEINYYFIIPQHDMDGRWDGAVTLPELLSRRSPILGVVQSRQYIWRQYDDKAWRRTWKERSYRECEIDRRIAALLWSRACVSINTDHRLWEIRGTSISSARTVT